jgi:DNA invertase Pin-like site-specific DNA recombinase
MLVGYARVSTLDQNLDLQIDALIAAGCKPEHIFTDKASGYKEERKGLIEAFNFLRPGDVFCVWKLDRFGRSLPHLVNFLLSLKERGVEFKSLTEALDTTTAMGVYVFQMLGAAAQFEGDIKRERTRAGLAAARARGRKGGRPRALSRAKFELLKILYNQGDKTVREIAEMLDVCPRTVYEYLEREERNKPK